MVIVQGMADSSCSRRCRTPRGRFVHGGVPLLGMDMREHAYYLDYQSRKGGCIEACFSELASWDFAEEKLRHAS